MTRPTGFVLLAPALAALAVFSAWGLLYAERFGGSPVLVRLGCASLAATTAVAAEALWRCRPWAAHATWLWVAVAIGWMLAVPFVARSLEAGLLILAAAVLVLGAGYYVQDRVATRISAGPRGTP